MNYKPYPTEFWTQIESTLHALKHKLNNQKKLYAAFDADGTLWDTDLGENFFQYQIDNNQVELPKNPFEHYLALKKVNSDPRAAYVWLAQINKGQKLETVRTWAEQAFNAIKPNPIFSEQRKLIELLQKNQVEIYIVTASIKWAVEPGAKALGINADHVIGVETVVENNQVTDKPIYPITYRSGKTEALLKITDHNYPFLASGNSLGDLELLESATHIKLAVSAASRDDQLFRAEHELFNLAKNKGWLAHRFI